MTEATKKKLDDSALGMPCAFVIPSFNAGPHLRRVISDLTALLASDQAFEGKQPGIFVVDDGSTDDSTLNLPEGPVLLRHAKNRGKGAALLAGFQAALERGFEVVITLDADGQHPCDEALRLLRHPASKDTLVLAVRDLSAAGAPGANQWSNNFSNRVLSLFSGEKLLDTQCGLRRYPVRQTLALGSRASGYAYEADLVLRAARSGVPIAHMSCQVLYPKGDARVSHFDSVWDPARIVAQVVSTTLLVEHHRASRRWSRRLVLLGVLGAALFWLLR